MLMTGSQTVRMLMKRRVSIAYLSAIIAACGLNVVFATDPPASAEQLRNQLESAFNNRDANAIVSLMCWDGVDSEVKEMESAMMAVETAESGTNIAHFTLSPVPTNFQTTVMSFVPDWEGDHGTRGKYNIPVIGMIRMNQLGEDQKGKYPDVPYGKKSNAFYIAHLISYRIPGKALNVRVDNLPTFLTYTGYWVYVQDGKEISSGFARAFGFRGRAGTQVFSRQSSRVRIVWVSPLKAKHSRQSQPRSFAAAAPISGPDGWIGCRLLGLA